MRFPQPSLPRRAVLVLPLLGAAACSSRPSPSASTPPASSSTPSPTIAPSSGRAPSPSASRAPGDPLTGGRVSRNAVFAVKIENTAPARPQIGLDAADLVFVEQVEAGITRLIGIFHTSFPSVVGPVRSARNTDAQLLPVFGRPGLVYSGANRLVQDQLRKASLVPIERSDRDHRRVAPHNVMVDLKALAAQHRVGAVRDIGLRFGPAAGVWAKASAASSAAAIVGHDSFRFDHGPHGYTIRWNAQTYNGGGGPLTCDNVLVLHVRNHKDTHTTSNLSVVSDTVGEGDVDVYRDGKSVRGRWRRTRVSAPFSFTAGGSRVPLAPGRTWILLRG